MVFESKEHRVAFSVEMMLFPAGVNIIFPELIFVSGVIFKIGFL